MHQDAYIYIKDGRSNTRRHGLVYTHGREVGQEWKGRRHLQSVEEANLFVCLPNFEGLISPVT